MFKVNFNLKRAGILIFSLVILINKNQIVVHSYRRSDQQQLC